MLMRKHSSGFTVVELIVALAVVAILATAALPAMGGLISRNKVASEVNRLASDLLFARNSAVTRGRVVTVCRSGDQTACLSSPSAAGRLDAGWMTYTADEPLENFDGALGEVLKVGEKVSETIEIRVLGNQAPDYISFLPSGRIEGASPGNIVITICKDGQSTDQVTGRRVTLSTSGRPSLSEIAAGQSCS
jgi:type IV fimbrial biogenesis protein FimT